MDNTLLGILFLATGIADIVLARAMTQLSGLARTMLYVFGGAFLALGATLLLGYQRSA
jgi:hypothetical protein